MNDHESRVERFAARLAMGRGLYAFAEAARASGRVRRALSRMRQRALCGALLSLPDLLQDSTLKPWQISITKKNVFWISLSTCVNCWMNLKQT